MKQLSLWFALFSCAMLGVLLPESCTKENGIPDQKNLSKTSALGVEKPSTITPAADPAIAYDGAIGKSNGIVVMNADGSNQTLLLSGSVGLPSWSPDGHSILFSGTVGGVKSSFGIVDVSVINGKVTGSNVRRIPITQSGVANGGRWSPLGDLIVFIFEDKNVYTVPPTGGTATIVYTSPAGLTPFDPEWSQDASRIVFTEWNDAFTQSNLQVLDRTTGVITTVRPLTSELIYSPTWSRHGDRIAYTGSGGIRTVTPTANATPVNVTNGSYQTWSPDDSKLAFRGGKQSNVETYAFSGGTITSLASSGVFADWRRF
jgi:Tol biopolymer transport system component